MGAAAQKQEVEDAAPQLTAINGMRFVAVFHIFLYHLDGSAYLGIDTMPHWLDNLFEHGYVSTSFFFLLSGFILAYLYWKPDGELAISRTRFWWQRFSRVYPVHLIALLVTMVIEISLWRAGHDAPPLPTAVASAVATMTLTQAWFAPLVPLWSWPTWALSALVFLYLIMPWLMRLLAKLSRAQGIAWLVAMPLISLLPTLVYLCVYPDGAPHSRNRQILLGSTPLFWVAHFVAGMLMSRIFAISRFERGWRERPRLWLSAGDFALAALITLCLTDPPSLPWRFILRHGALMPLHLIVLHDLALGRGFASRLLASAPLRFLGQTSFSIFIWQNVILALGGLLLPVLAISRGMSFALAVVALLLIAILSTYFLEKPIARWLRRMGRVQGMVTPIPT